MKITLINKQKEEFMNLNLSVVPMKDDVIVISEAEHYVVLARFIHLGRKGIGVLVTETPRNN